MSRLKTALGSLLQQNLALIVLLVTLVLTSIAWKFADNAIHANVRQRFEFQAEDVSAAIAKRLRDYETILRSGVGVFNASNSVTRAEWQEYVAGLELQKYLPGIQGLGFCKLIPAAALPAHIQEVRQQGYPEYTVFPAGERDLYSSILYLEPFDAVNQRALGYDMLTEPVRRAAMEKARDTGLPTISGRLKLIQETDRNVQYGFVMYMPVYAKGAAHATLEERRQAIIGFVSSPFRAGDLMRGILGRAADTMDLALYDGKVAGPDNLLFSNTPLSQSEREASLGSDEFSSVLSIDNASRDWTLVLRSRSAYWSSTEDTQVLLLAIGGIAFDLFVFYLLGSYGLQKKRLEVFSRQLQEQLRESELLLHSAVSAIGEAFVIYDKEDRLAFFNEEYREVYLTSAPVIEIGRTFEEIIRYGAERGQYQEAVGRVEEWVAERLAIHRKGNTDLTQRLDNGRWVKIRERKTAGGQIVGFRVDVTDLFRAIEGAEAATRAKSEFLATISHEIRTPMNGMLVLAQVLMTAKVSDEERVEYARAMLRSGETLLNLLNDILDFSKSEAGKLVLHPVDFSPVELIRESVFLFHEAAQRKQLKIRASSPLSEDWHCYADDARIRQMLFNLIGNAIKFTTTGGVTVEVVLLEEVADELTLEFSVRDSGPGVPEDKIPLLFQPFSQADSSTVRQYGGTGLGLSIVKKFAMLMGGDAGLTSELGQGSRFSFRIKVDKQPPTAVGGQERRPHAAASKPQQLLKLQGHVLVADDDPLSRLVIVSTLTKLGLTTETVNDGQQALQRIKSGVHYDIILMDIVMPVLGGIEAAQAIRKWHTESGLAQQPIVAISADAFDEDKQRCRESGLDEFLEKPLDLNRMMTVLAHWLPQAGVEAEQDQDSLDTVLDWEVLVQAVAAIMPLLEQQKFDAFESFKALKGLTRNTKFAAEVGEIGRLLDDLNFSEAARRLADMVKDKGVA